MSVNLSPDLLRLRNKEFEFEGIKMTAFSAGCLFHLCLKVKVLAETFLSVSTMACFSPFFYSVLMFEECVITGAFGTELMKSSNYAGLSSEAEFHNKKRELFVSVCEKYGIILGVFAKMIARRPQNEQVT